METYKYLVLRYRPSLYLDEKNNFAVVVEGKLGDRGVVLAISRSPVGSAQANEITRTIGQNISAILQALIREGVDAKRPDEGLLDWVANHMRWNFSATNPERLEASDPIQTVSFKLFSKYVVGADDLIESYEKAVRQSIPPTGAIISLGETYINILPVPGPALAASAG